MRILKPLRFVIVALGSIFVAMLAFGASLAVAVTPPSDTYTWPEAGPGGSASDVLAIVLPLCVIVGAIAYGFVALRRERIVSEVPSLRVVPGGQEREHERKAA
jgi:hypothetical protein